VLYFLLQAKLCLADVAWGGQFRQVGLALFETLEGLGNEAGTGAIIRRASQGFVEGDA
jgi:hypothetical protein